MSGERHQEHHRCRRLVVRPRSRRQPRLRHFVEQNLARAATSRYSSHPRQVIHFTTPRITRCVPRDSRALGTAWPSRRAARSKVLWTDSTTRLNASGTCPSSNTSTDGGLCRTRSRVVAVRCGPDQGPRGSQASSRAARKRELWPPCRAR